MLLFLFNKPIFHCHVLVQSWMCWLSQRYAASPAVHSRSSQPQHRKNAVQSPRWTYRWRGRHELQKSASSLWLIWGTGLPRHVAQGHCLPLTPADTSWNGCALELADNVSSRVWRAKCCHTIQCRKWAVQWRSWQLAVGQVGNKDSQLEGSCSNQSSKQRSYWPLTFWLQLAEILHSFLMLWLAEAAIDKRIDTRAEQQLGVK